MLVNPYRPHDKELRQLAARSRNFQYSFNQEQDVRKRSAILKEWFGSTGENISMNPNLVCDYGVNIHLGENFYSNWNMTMLDVCPIRIGDNVVVGAGSVVTKSFGDNVVLAGNPARIIKEIPKTKSNKALS